MRGRLYSSCASSTWSLPSALRRAGRRCRGSAASGRRRGPSGRSRACAAAAASARRRRGALCADSAYACFSSSSLPLPTYVAGPGRAVLDERPDRLDARRARELSQLRVSSSSGATPGRGRRGRTRARARRPGGGIWLMCRHASIMPARNEPIRCAHGLLQPIVRDRQRDADEPLAARPVGRSRRDDDRGALEHKLGERLRREPLGNPRPRSTAWPAAVRRGGRSRAEPRRRGRGGACRRRTSQREAARLGQRGRRRPPAPPRTCPSRCSSSAGGTARRSPRCRP